MSHDWFSYLKKKALWILDLTANEKLATDSDEANVTLSATKKGLLALFIYFQMLEVSQRI